MKIRLGVFLLALLALSSGVVYGAACDLVSAQSDTALAVGVFLFGALLLGVPYLGAKICESCF